MRPLEDIAIPLSEVEETDHADDVQTLDGDNAGSKPRELMLPWRRKRKHRGNQDDRGFDAVAARLDRHRKSVRRRAQDLAGGGNPRIESGDQRRRNMRKRAGPWLDKPLLRPRRQLESEQQCEQYDEQNKEADHRRILTTWTAC